MGPGRGIVFLYARQQRTMTLAALRKTDEVAYLRFASVYKDFEGAADFERELVSLQKKVPAKRRSSS